ncbi:MAG: hybrid sensor histidine kinase/response regulator [Deltaproteobacteria bacterium RIFOXYD12_FULL_57_12]|nr:MAG: hybrid sensor histidine kinase/response regulator [Deltaproteobacteria bacterium RIFOXYD12_FULL_57_12]
MRTQDDETLQVYIDESIELLADVENDFLAIEKSGAEIDLGLVNKVFRTAHSIKGGAGFLGFGNVKELAHKMENILGLIRSRELLPDKGIINVLLLAADALRDMINNLRESSAKDISQHIEALNAIVAGRGAGASSAVLAGAGRVSVEPPRAEAVAPTSQPEPVLPAASQEVPAVPDRAPARTVVPEAAPPTKGAGAESTLRVHVSLLDSLMNMAGELVLGRNQLLQAIYARDSRMLEVVGQRVDLITTELQEAIMMTRLQPISNVFGKIPRLVRDLANEVGKSVDLVVSGEEVELDKTIIEAIRDPLTHLIRNAVDHGIERPEERIRAGKDLRGRLLLRASHEAGQVTIEVADDGRGLDVDKVEAAALARGLVAREQVREMSAKEKIRLILLPGFSMADRITDVSGRGVGMDVVKTNVEKLGGQVEIDSRLGLGTTIGIKLPLTLAIISCQLVRDAMTRYAVPQVNLVELVRIPAEQVKKRIEKVGDASVVRLRGRLLPLVRLADVLERERRYHDPDGVEYKMDRRQRLADRRSRDLLSPGQDESDCADASMRNNGDRRYRAASAVNIAVCAAAGGKFGLVVDELLDSEEIVVKPLGRHFKHIKIYAGATIMGDGSVALILDVANIARDANLITVEHLEQSRAAGQDADDGIAENGRQNLLVFSGGEGEQFAVPIDQVLRIEKIKAAQIEEIGGKRILQYRDRTLALYNVDRVARVKPLPDRENLLVIIFQHDDREVGLLAVEPVNTSEIPAAVDEKTHRQPGIRGSVIINGHVTLLVDINEILKGSVVEARPGAVPAVVPLAGSGTILYAEDSAFFRSQVTGFLREAGYQVLEAIDGQIAWELLQKNVQEVRLVLTDVEMPNMDGLGLTAKIRADKRCSRLPIIALTTLASEEDIARGREIGVDEYLIKLDRESLLERVAARLDQKC